MSIKILKSGHCKHCGRKLGADDLADECDDTVWCVSATATRDDATDEDMLVADAVRELASIADRWRYNDAPLTERDLFSTAQMERSQIW